MRRLAFGFDHGAQESGGGAFAICASNMNSRRQAQLRITERAKHALDAAKTQVYFFGMKRGELR